MKKVIACHLADAKLQDASKLYRVEIIRCGRWDYPRPGDEGFEITPATIAELHDNFKAGLMGPEVAVNTDHFEIEDQPPSTFDCGWVRDVEVGNAGKSLFGLIEITDPEIRGKVDNQTIKYCSAELDFERVDPERSATLGDMTPRKVLEGLALTNHPYVKHMQHQQHHHQGTPPHRTKTHSP